MNPSLANLTIIGGILSLMVATAMSLWSKDRSPAHVAMGVILAGATLSIASYHLLWTPKMELKIEASTTKANFPANTKLAGIDWTNNYAMVRVVIVNQTNKNYEGLDLNILPNSPVVAAGQESSVEGVSFSPTAAPMFDMELVNSTTRERTVVPLVLVATNAGYRVRCDKLPSKHRLVLVFAGVEMSAPTHNPGVLQEVLSLNYWCRIKNDKNGTSAWFGHSNHAGVIFSASRPVVSLVDVRGRFTAMGRVNEVKQAITVRDSVGDALKLIMPQAGSPNPSSHKSPQ
jgi:hypothetical protein